jgi:hypothetical protein
MNEALNLKLTNDGSIGSLIYNNETNSVKINFRSDEYAGPQWYVELGDENHKVELKQKDDLLDGFEGVYGDIVFSLHYRTERDWLAVTAVIANNGSLPFCPAKAGLKMGIDAYMESFPEWNEKLFPTLLRCEKTHFWGYCMSPLGKILAMGSPDPVASWSMDYNRSPYGDGGHRIYTFNLDLINTLPLPERYPKDITSIKPGEKREWTIYLKPVESLESLKTEIAEICQVPMFELDRYTLMEHESAKIKVSCEGHVELKVVSPKGKISVINPLEVNGNIKNFQYSAKEEFGVYTLLAIAANGKQAEAKLYLRKPWSWYLTKAREEAINKPQKATTHTESWYGHFSNFLAKKYFPDPVLDQKAEENFRRILSLMYDLDKAEPIVIPNRIQNTACMISLLVDVYEANGDIKDIEFASKLADWMILSQNEDGAYTNSGQHYTSVVYIAKSMLELAVAEEKLARDNEAWKLNYERHYNSAKAAVDELERKKDNIGTEGEHTFEDGMISCTSLQLGLFALLQKDPAMRRKYADAASQVLNKHRCLEQLEIPDCRMNGCTLRFWEAQYDVLIHKNMLNSPHGWTSWKTYASWYLYQLTGEEHYLRTTMDTLGSCMQVIDVDTGNLRWGFVPDPYIKAEVWVEDKNNPGKGTREERVIGEQYVEMISGWWRTPEDKMVGGYLSCPLITRDGVFKGDNQGGCCDNDVHEHFKCLEEVALTSAYIIEHNDGDITAWNCHVESVDNALHVYPAEDIVDSVHVNIKNTHKVTVHFTGTDPLHADCSGLQWLRKQGDR